MPFVFEPTRIPEVIKITPKVFSDSRGSFAELYKESDFKQAGIEYDFVQDNFPVSQKGVIRGLHFQLQPHTQGKLVAALKGAIFDVAVDVRTSSPTFGQWVSEELTEKNRVMLFIPPGFAHGFAALEDDTRVLYKMTSLYAPEFDRGVLYSDPDLAIPWPVSQAVVSEKDAALPLLKDAELFL